MNHLGMLASKTILGLGAITATSVSIQADYLMIPASESTVSQGSCVGACAMAFGGACHHAVNQACHVVGEAECAGPSEAACEINCDGGPSSLHLTQDEIDAIFGAPPRFRFPSVRRGRSRRIDPLAVLNADLAARLKCLRKSPNCKATITKKSSNSNEPKPNIATEVPNCE